MSEVDIVIHKKFYERWADIFIAVMNKDGFDKANEWAERTLSRDQIQELIPVIQSKRRK